MADCEKRDTSVSQQKMWKKIKKKKELFGPDEPKKQICSAEYRQKD